MNRKISLGLAVSIVAVTVTLAVVATYTAAMRTFDSRMSGVTERQTMYDLISELDLRSRLSFYGKVDEQKLSESLAAGYVAGLGDEYGEYLTAEEYSARTDRDAGYDFGLGIDIAKNSDGNILVNRIISGSPAEDAKVKKGDVIISVGGKSVTSSGYDKAVAAIEAASPKVSFVVRRNSKEYKYTVTKSTYTIVSIENNILENDVGYIRITEFNEKTPDQFNSALNNLKRAGVTGLIIDLRDNKTGSYEHACEILDTLLPAGNLMLSVDRDGNEKILYTSDTRDYKLPTAVLINENTAGAAELFASAFADFGRADLVGVTTYGKNTVQELFKLSDGTAVELTVARWKTASNKSIKKGRIVPGFEVKLTDYQQENRFLLSEGEDPQLQTALECISNRMSEREEEEPEENVSDSDAQEEPEETTTTTTTTSTTAPSSAVSPADVSSSAEQSR